MLQNRQHTAHNTQHTTRSPLHSTHYTWTFHELYCLESTRAFLVVVVRRHRTHIVCHHFHM